jgi:Zinc knuckle
MSAPATRAAGVKKTATGAAAGAAGAAAAATAAAPGVTAAPSAGAGAAEDDAGLDEAGGQEGTRGTSAAEAASQAQLLLLQQRIAELEAKTTALVAEKTALAAQAAAATAGGARQLRAEADDALQAAHLEEEEREDAAAALVAAAEEEKARPGEQAEEADLQRRLAEVVATRMQREHAAAATAAAAAEAAAQRRRAAQDSPQAQAVAQRSLLQQSPQPSSPPVMQRSGGGARVAQQQAGSSGGLTPAAIEAYKMLRPARLQATEAAKGTTLEDWIFNVEQVIQCAGALTFAARMELVAMCWDRQVHTWWTGAQDMAATRGRPIVDWAGFLAALRGNYTPISDEDTACTLLFQLAMRSGESMDHYVSRAHELFNRIPRWRVAAEMAAEFLQRGVDARRFPLALVAVGVEQQRERARGRGLPFDTLRSMLVEAAAREPTHLIASAQAAASSSGAGGYSQRGGQGGRQRVNNISTQEQGRYPRPEEDGEEEHSERAEGSRAGEQYDINAVDVADVKCFRCQQRGHFAKDCSRPDTRSCNICKKKGHLARDCRSKASAPGGSSSSSSGPSEKAQGGAQGGAKPTNS